MRLLFNLFLLLITVVTANGQEIRSFKDRASYGFKKEGTVIIDPAYEYAFDFNEGRALVRKGGLWGFIDENNSEVIPFQFDRCSEFENGYATVVLSGKTGIIDTRGTFVVPAECSDVKVLENGFCIGKNNGGFALYLNGKRLSEFAYDNIGKMYCDFFTFKQGEWYGVLTMDGRELIPANFSHRPYCYKVKEDHEGLYFSGKSKNSKNPSYYNGKGELIIDGEMFEARQILYPTPIYSATKNNETKVVNVITGEEIIPMMEISEYDVNWRPCDGIGYRSPSQFYFQKGENLLMVSSEAPYHRVEIPERPIILEEFIIVPKEPHKADIYSHNVELLIADVDYKIDDMGAFNIEERICSITERNVWLWKDDQFVTWDSATGTPKLASTFSYGDSSLFHLNKTSLHLPATFNVLASQGDDLVFEVTDASDKYLLMLKNGGILWEMDILPVDAKVKFKKFESDSYEEGGKQITELYNVVVKVNGKKMEYGW